MATIRKRRWVNGSGEQVAWIADYFDQNKDEQHPRGHRHIRSFANRRAAKAWLAETVIEVQRKIHTPHRQSITVAAAAALWIEKTRDAEKRVRSTVQQYQNHVRLYINPMIGGARLSDLAPRNIEEFRDALLRKLSRVMARKVLVSLKSILANARRTGRMAHSPADDVKIAADKRGRRKLKIGVDIPTKDDARRIIAAVDPRWRPIILTALFTGMRSSELRALIWDKVNFKDKKIHVDQRVDDWGNWDPPKSDAGDREIPMSPEVFRTLREWKLACPKGELGLVFPTGIGTVECHRNIYSRGWHAAQIAAEVTKKDGRAKYGPFHGARHFFASLIIERGYSPKRCQVLLGHSSIQLTFDTYGHLFPDDEADQDKFAEAELSVLGNI
jgi:integrase